MPSAPGRAPLLPYLDTLFRSAPAGVALFDRDLSCVRANDRIAGFAGVTADQLIGLPAFQVLPGMGDVVESRLRKVLDSGLARHDCESVGETSAHPGLRRTFQADYEPVRDPASGDVVGVIALVNDVTVSRAAQAEAAVARDRDRLAAQVRAELVDAPHDPGRVARRLGELLTAGGMATHCLVALLDRDGEGLDTLAAVSVGADDELTVADWLDVRPFGGAPAAAAVRGGRCRRFAADTPAELGAQLGGGYEAVVRALGLRAALVAPLRSHGEVVGAVLLGRDVPFGLDDELLARQVGDVAGMVLANARLMCRHRRYLAVVEAMAGSLTLGAVYQAVLPVLRDALEVDTVRFLLLSADGSHLYGGVAVGLEAELPPGERQAIGEGFAGRVGAERRAVVVERVERAPFVEAALRDAGVEGLAGVPVADDDLFGVLLVGSRRHRRFHADDLELLELTADRLALALRQDRTEKALLRTAAFSRSVLETAVDAVITIDEQGEIMTVNPAACHMFQYAEDELVGENVSVLMPEPERGAHDRYVARFLATGEARLAGASREMTARRRDGTLFPVELGVSEVNLEGRQRFFTGIVHDITERRRAQEELRHQALHDPLTGLPNRALFGDHLDEALARSVRSGAPVGVLLIDLDRFKQINDTFGHPGGDELLRQAARRLRSAVRPADTVARLGGDEFGVLVQDARRAEDVVRVAQRIHDRFQVPFTLGDRHVSCPASIGVAQGRRSDRGGGTGASGAGGVRVEGPAELLRHADAALYLAKERGRDRYEVFDEPMRSRLHARLRDEQELALAIDEGHVEPHFQPLFDLRENRITVVEALARWRHPERGLLPAAEFIPLAEETGLIVPLGARVLEQAGRARERWRATSTAPTPDLAVNLSAAELAVTGATGVIGWAGGAGGQLWVELSEVDPGGGERSGCERTELRRRGVRLAVDGFGAGRSSVAELAGRRAEVIKIDRRFVSGLGVDPEATAVVRAAAALGRASGLDVVAVGLERIDQLELLRRLGCTHVQGLAIAPAVPAGEVPDLVRFWR